MSEVKNLNTVEDVYNEYHAQDRLNGDISRLERDIEFAELRIKRGAAFKRLRENPDFKEIFEEGYFKDLANGAIRSLGKGQDVNVPKEEWVEILSGIGHLQTYLEGVEQFESQAETMLPQFKDELTRLKTTQNTTFK
jgi:hypothetical protein